MERPKLDRFDTGCLWILRSVYTAGLVTVPLAINMAVKTDDWRYQLGAGVAAAFPLFTELCAYYGPRQMQNAAHNSFNEAEKRKTL